ncbi:MAG: HAD-IB family hydrolase [Luminiphilus sp.]|jgi:HAD superfamily hydrolase (TIGR01490 family)|nr:HAD-IB family hydrolase [Luminiphilus sp.]
MALAIFDLDNTLLDGDSDHRWGEFLCQRGMVTADDFAQQNDRFYADYQAGTLDMTAYLTFVLAPLAGRSHDEVAALQRQFISDCIEPMLLDKAFALINQHRIAGDILLLMTATHAVVAEPVAARLGFQHWLGSGVSLEENGYTGKPEGLPCFQEGKISHLHAWRAKRDTTPDLSDTWFYSDSHNDLPLLSRVGHPVAVDPDATLLQHAEQESWPIISLRD